MVIYINGEITQEVANSVRDQLAKSKDPIELHQRVPLYIGSKKDVELAEAFISGKRS